MTTDLQTCIDDIRIIDTHEHMGKQDAWEGQKPDILHELFGNYVRADFISAGASQEAVTELFNEHNPDVEARFNPLHEAWDAIRLTGYGRASRIVAETFFDIDDINAGRLAAAQARLPERWAPLDRLRILKETGGLHHIQTDDFCWPCVPDSSGPDFFLYDLSWASFCRGTPDFEKLHQETGVEVKDLDTLDEAMAALFDRYAPCAIAVKAQHAYSRTLRWQERSDQEATRALDRALSAAAERSVEETNCLGDWCWARGVELSIRHNLPFKLHTGYYAGNDRMPVDFIRAGNLCALLKKYPQARFVLMHISYPYEAEVLALAKHYRNVWVDLCWAWAIDPHASAEFVRRFLHAAPANKLFGFGGDSSRPRTSVAYAIQARKWLGRALQAEVDASEMTEQQAMDVARLLLQKNQLQCFDYDGTLAAIQETAAVGADA